MTRNSIHRINDEIEYSGRSLIAVLAVTVHAAARLNQTRRTESFAKASSKGQVKTRLQTPRRNDCQVVAPFG
jgi:hypothetical protein